MKSQKNKNKDDGTKQWHEVLTERSDWTTSQMDLARFNLCEQVERISGGEQLRGGQKHKAQLRGGNKQVAHREAFRS